MKKSNDCLGEFEHLVLLAVLRLGDEAYGTSVRNLLKDLVARDVSIGALYATLERLELKSLVSSSLGEATEMRGGRAKRYFHVTAKGRKALQKTRQNLEMMWKDIAIYSHEGLAYE